MENPNHVHPIPSHRFAALMAFFAVAELTYIQVKYMDGSPFHGSKTNRGAVQNSITSVTVSVIAFYLESVFRRNIILERLFGMIGAFSGSLCGIYLMEMIQKSSLLYLLPIWYVSSLIAGARMFLHIHRHWHTIDLTLPTISQFLFETHVVAAAEDDGGGVAAGDVLLAVDDAGEEGENVLDDAGEEQGGDVILAVDDAGEEQGGDVILAVDDAGEEQGGDVILAVDDAGEEGGVTGAVEV